ncbi:MAG: response regulator [Kofleriaceae bacterium]
MLLPQKVTQMPDAPITSVVIADDDAVARQAYERSFRHLGMTPWVAESSAQALALLEEVQPRLVVIELRLGSESGLDLIKRVRQQSPDCTIALVSAYLSVASTAAALRSGADIVLFKPAQAADILRQIDVEDYSNCESPTPTLARVEWEHIHRVLSDCNGNISQAARRLGILRQSLQRKLRRYAPLH